MHFLGSQVLGFGSDEASRIVLTLHPFETVPKMGGVQRKAVVSLGFSTYII